jgi:hypothetical protein
MVNSAPVSNRIRLAHRYRKPQPVVFDSRLCGLGAEDAGKVTVSLAPVLYHGTCRIVVERWRRAEITNRSLSLEGDPRSAAFFASYSIKEHIPMDYIRLKSGAGRGISFFKWDAEQRGIIKEYERLENGRMVNAIAFFDRDSLLAEAAKKEGLSIYAESDSRIGDDRSSGIEDNRFSGIMLRWEEWSEKNRLGTDSLFASLELDMGQGIPNLRVFSQELWERNFSVPVPKFSSGETFRTMTRLAYLFF